MQRELTVSTIAGQGALNTISLLLHENRGFQRMDEGIEAFIQYKNKYNVNTFFRGFVLHGANFLLFTIEKYSKRSCFLENLQKNGNVNPFRL